MHGQHGLPKTVRKSSVAAVAGPRQLPQGMCGRNPQRIPWQAVHQLPHMAQHVPEIGTTHLRPQTPGTPPLPHTWEEDAPDVTV